MKIATIKKLCCPFDHADLQLTTISTNLEGDVLEGFLHCTTCTRLYPIVKGIPIMSPDEYREFSLEQPLLERWEKHLEGKTYKNFRLTGTAVNVIDKQ
ncbi:hypothetical protein AM493_05730 [Flavobacterium akiainvivens]|uniref:Trm112 family protein n=1 Tax=Flavobacterium akiainvivens TaxID=1202724 RepID=A0A0M8MHA6_9FLAO|nr:Trm112 family protein [Flavobacterium akiainvivens]KOS05588.1 hypothetical protein AM493_05730 [Flavobacterium akiainvivens]SFQ34867.1 Uncharacterized conserved protein YbaR, Trm112 family [Flavobacterium akiainvivens]